MKGINFIEPLFHKVVSGEKTQTRRIINPQPDFQAMECYPVDEFGTHETNGIDSCGNYIMESIKPKHKPGEILYIKEPYIIYQVLNHMKYQDGRSFSEISDGMIGYKYDGHDSVDDFVRHVHLMGGLYIEKVYVQQNTWKNKLFMPEKYARYFIEITGVRAERLQDISDEDCMKEGIREERFVNFPYETFYVIPDMSCPLSNTPREAYADLIDKIGGEGTWESNPFVWVYDFKLKAK
jgi:hypothetical protein